MKKGFTLIETIVVIVLVGIISYVLAFYIRESFSAWMFISGQKSIAMSSRKVIYRMVRELKRIDKNTSITTFTSKEVTFLDIDNNTVTFSQEGTALLRNGNILLENLQDPCGLNFIYLEKNGATATINSNIRVICIWLTVIKGENKFVIESAARVRNL